MENERFLDGWIDKVETYIDEYGWTLRVDHRIVNSQKVKECRLGPNNLCCEILLEDEDPIEWANIKIRRIRALIRLEDLEENMPAIFTI